MLESDCDLKMYVRNLGYPLPYKSRSHCKTTYFRRLRNLTATLTAYVLRMKHDIDNRASALETTRGLLHRLEMSCTLVHKRLKLDRSLYPPSANSAFYFTDRQDGDQQTELNQTLPNGGQ